MSHALPDYVELHCQSNFTFLHGASHPEELVERASQLGYRGIAITDECSLAGVVRAHVEAKKRGDNFCLILGSEITLACGTKVVLLATNLNGYGNLSELITIGRRRAEKGRYELHRHDLEHANTLSSAPHLAGLPDCLALLIPQRGTDQKIIEEQAQWLARTFPTRAWIAVELLYWSDDDAWLAQLHAVAAATALPLTATGAVLMHVRSRKPLQDTLTAIRLGKTVADCGLDLQPNAEQHLRSRMRLAQIYAADLLQETLRIAARCNFSLTEISYQYPEEIVPQGETLSGYLRRLTYEGAANHWREKGIPDNIQKQIEHELTLITELRYIPFFLTVYDIVQFAHSRNILCQGRGSAANSVVCFCLGITAVNPEQSNVLFERFISRERDEPPDIDVDFEHQRREEVMQYIYQKYGRHRAALAASLITYRPRSAMKDVGKALGLDFDQVNRLSTSHKWWDGREVREERLRECGFDPQSSIVQKLVELTGTLIGFPRHLSQHVGGFVIARDNLARLVPIENASMKDRSVIQWDKDDLESLKLIKVDVLALGMLSAIRRAIDMLRVRLNEPAYEIRNIPDKDLYTYDMICQADTIGVFQIESRAQMSMLPRLRPREYYDLVVQVAIVRPGPIQGGMVHPYLTQRHIPRGELVLRDELKNALERTHGVPIFQEQVMQIAIDAAGFTPGEADKLRRAMGAWKRKGTLEEYNDKLRAGLAKNNFEPEFAERLIRQIAGFGEYGFPESHAASFALLVYISAWIKRHHPSVFLAALLNSQPMGFYSASQLVQDAKRHGVPVYPVDVMQSDIECTLEDIHSNMPPVRLGLSMIKGLSSDSAARIVRARMQQPFCSIDDLARRAQLDQFELGALARANALLPLSGHRRQAKWDVSAMRPASALLRDAPINEAPLILPPASEGQEIVADYASVGLTLKRHPLALLRPRLKQMNLSTALEMRGFANRKIARTTGIVTMRQRPPTAKGTMFVTLEDETGITNVIIWPDLIEKQRKEILNAQLMTVYGIWQTKDDVHHLVAKRIVDHSHLLGALNINSRDFQ
ncbi:MAG: error-prone DNA polymerase [Oxalicibacterium faecigallinarum]|uniref:error-prone DNA polymerase n=1 Tax=Oxalicibacterium faecigallinarum TaxID=573741 RepID=UPI002807C1FA|nr:error-prone DNA polymerase [Oxalicibacterium faecigallinarum]MDQ7968146.1 error-prone DNA polymerase [Oxalicibacterium faecigallinarum]